MVCDNRLKCVSNNLKIFFYIVTQVTTNTVLLQIPEEKEVSDLQ